MSAPEPIAVVVREAVRLSGLSRSMLYRLMAEGQVRAVKAGARTLILVDSLRTHLASLPPATIRPPRAKP